MCVSWHFDCNEMCCSAGNKGSRDLGGAAQSAFCPSVSFLPVRVPLLCLLPVFGWGRPFFFYQLHRRKTKYSLTLKYFPILKLPVLLTGTMCVPCSFFCHSHGGAGDEEGLALCPTLPLLCEGDEDPGLQPAARVLPLPYPGLHGWGLWRQHRVHWPVSSFILFPYTTSSEESEWIHFIH